MKRLLTALGLLLLAGTAHGFDPAPAPERIGVLRSHDERTPYESAIEKSVHDALCNVLRAKGFEVVLVEESFDELSLNADRDADWYIELVPASGETVDYGGVGVGGQHADVSLGIVVSRVAAEANVYRGRTLELLATETLAKKNTAVLPTAVGIGGGNIFAAIALPFVTRAQERSVARSAGRELASRVIAVIRPE